MASNPCIILRNAADRGRACLWINQAEDGVVVEFKKQKRTGDQNAAMWSLISQILKQRPTHNGMRMTGNLWKAVFLQALGTELLMVPTLDGDGFFPVGQSSSRLTVEQMSALIELMLAWSATQGLTIQHFDAEPGKVAA